jgi:hypothetical protein
MQLYILHSNIRRHCCAIVSLHCTICWHLSAAVYSTPRFLLVPQCRRLLLPALYAGHLSSALFSALHYLLAPRCRCILCTELLLVPTGTSVQVFTCTALFSGTTEQVYTYSTQHDLLAALCMCPLCNTQSEDTPVHVDSSVHCALCGHLCTLYILYSTVNCLICLCVQYALYCLQAPLCTFTLSTGPQLSPHVQCTRSGLHCQLAPLSKYTLCTALSVRYARVLYARCRLVVPLCGRV